MIDFIAETLILATAAIPSIALIHISYSRLNKRLENSAKEKLDI